MKPSIEAVEMRSGDEQMKSDALRVVEVTTRKCLQKQLEWTRRRDEAIVIARHSGASLREVAAAAGLSHVAVKKIVDRYEP